MRGALLLLVTIAAAAAQDRTITSESEVRVVAFSKDGSTVLGICGDRKLRYWDARSGSLRTATGWADDERPAALLPGSGLFALIFFVVPRHSRLDLFEINIPTVNHDLSN